MKAQFLLLLAITTLVNSASLRKTPVNGRLQRSPEPAVMLTMMEPSGVHGLPLDQTSPHIPGEFPVAEETNPEVVKVPQAEPTLLQNDPKPEEDSDEDDSESDEPNFFIPKGRGGILNFFPIVFSGPGGSRSAGGPGGSTAISNSFSTGRRGSAVSHATAYGDSAAVLRNGRN